MMGGVCQSRVDGVGEIEMSVAVGIRTREIEKRLCRRMQYVRLEGGCLGARTLELQLEAQMLDGWKRDTQCPRARPIATQPLHPLLACGGPGNPPVRARSPER